MMEKRTLCSLCFVLVFCTGFAQLHPVPNESNVHFTIKNFGFSVDGLFSGIEGDIRFNPDSPSAACFQVSLNAASINTDNSIRDSHLRDEDYLDVKNHPRIQFLSENVRAMNKKGSFMMTGKLSIKNKTKEISFPFTASPSGNGYLFAGSFRISRRDFDVGGSSTVSDNLTVDLNVLAR